MRVRIEFQGPGFVAVPNGVAAMLGGALTPDALAVLVFCALRPVGSEWNVDTIRSGLGWGRDRWNGAAGVLRTLGALWDEVNTGDDGRHRGRVLCIRWPDVPKVVAKVRRPGKPKAGKAGQGRPGKPKAGKPGFRSSQVPDFVVETDDQLAQLDVASKTKTAEGVAPSGAATPSAGVHPESVASGVARSDAQKAEASRLVAEVVRALAEKDGSVRVWPCASGAGAEPDKAVKHEV